jgi:hypothetical protein
MKAFTADVFTASPASAQALKMRKTALCQKRKEDSAQGVQSQGLNARKCSKESGESGSDDKYNIFRNLMDAIRNAWMKKPIGVAI